MTGILADHNLIGQVAAAVARCGRPPWDEFWGDLGLTPRTFADLGFDRTTPDDIIRRRCQADGLILVTANRNHDGPDSLEAVIRAENTPTSLPVFTISRADRVLDDDGYKYRVTEQLMEYLTDIDRVRGTGRLFLP